MVIMRWECAVTEAGCQRGLLELWTAAAAALRCYLRGWGANHGSDSKRARARLVEEISALDVQVDSRVFSEAEWANRYAL